MALSGVVKLIQIVILFDYIKGSPLYQAGYPPNENWHCDGCGDDNATASIFGMIRHALYTQSREIYYPFDHSWIDTMLGTKEKVSVLSVSRDKLASYQPQAYQGANLPVDEVFKVIISFPNSNERKPLSFAETEIIDNFLSKNPCWMPIHEPPVAIVGETALTAAHQPNIFDYAAVFVQLPSYPYYSTCKFYQMVTRIQFPDKCPTVNETHLFRQYPLGNIGWSNLIHPLYERLRGTLRLDQMFINPRAFPNGPPATTRSVNGVPKKASGSWKWASPEECDPDTYAWNPYHCHFMSITGCNTPELHDALPDDENWRFKAEDYQKMEKSNYFKEREMIKSYRDKYGDAPRLGNEWEDTRLLAYSVRPNAAMRYRLRKQLQLAITVLKGGVPTSSTSIPSNGAITTTTTEHQHYHSHLNTHNFQVPTIGLHVRHGDSLNDFRREFHMDRSLARHVQCTNYLAERLGVNHLYLASDNVTLFSSAPEKYPQYVWMGQQRMLKLYNGHSFEGYFNEKSVHQDVANILVDLIMLSRTVGFIGARDSGFYVLVTNYQCMRNQKGNCPPTFSLEECLEKKI